MKHKTIINVINFIRGVEPRGEMDLITPIKEQLRLLSRYNMQGTFLMQYDALLDESFTSLLRGTKHEIGGWFEIVEPMVKAVGIPWRGRFPWDWHSHVGFSVGYSPKEREILVDEYMRLFHQTWGSYPQSVGSWLIDAHTLQYMSEQYGVIASCNCKDQWGTDGYTLWGGYYGQAYYPNKKNVYAPANSIENQIDVPIFKMLGSDPIYQYDAGLQIDQEGAADWQHVVTLEPVYTGTNGGGGVPHWVEWFFADVLQAPCLTFCYAQAGQENSFGWPAMKQGLEQQFELLHKEHTKGRFTIEPLCDSAKWYRERYKQTPASAITALTDWKEKGRKSVWYCSHRYRLNLYIEDEQLWIRDIQLFDDAYHERYLDAICTSPLMVYDNLPIVDGNRWSGNGIRAGWYFQQEGNPIVPTSIQVEEQDTSLLILIESHDGNIEILLSPTSFSLETALPNLTLEMRWGVSQEMDTALKEANKLTLTHQSFPYTIALEGARFEGNRIQAQESHVVFTFAT